MRDVVNFCLRVLVLFVATILFPTQVESEGLGAIIIVALIMSLINIAYVFAVCFLLTFVTSTNRMGMIGFAIVITVIIALLLNAIELYLISTYYSGFNINGGFFTYLFLSLALCIFSISEKKNKDKAYR